jgi:hypothetical protein
MRVTLPLCAAALNLAALPGAWAGNLRLGAEQFVQAAGSPIAVPGYSVPSFVDWNADGLKDLIVGEGSGTITPKVRVYLNTGTASAPQFSTFFYAQSNGADLTAPGSGCLGIFPRVVYWDADARKDLLVGHADGKVKLYLNVGTDAAPTFDAGTFLQVGQPGAKVTMSVVGRATPEVVDWNNDGRRDLVVGALDGRIHVFINQGADSAPDFRSDTLVLVSGVTLTVPAQRSCPIVRDLNGDGRKDILTGNTEGELLLYANVGTDDAPVFSGYAAVTAGGVAINLASTPRSRPFVCDWSGDGPPDVLIGSGDGTVRLYESAFVPGDTNCDGVVSFDDINPFVRALVGYEIYKLHHPECAWLNADYNRDGDVDFDDISPFVAKLTSPPGGP